MNSDQIPAASDDGKRTEAGLSEFRKLYEQWKQAASTHKTGWVGGNRPLHRHDL